MPVHYNDGLDDQLAYDLTGTFIGGQVSNVRANLLKDSQFSEAKNMDIDRFGAITTRRGTSLVGSTLTDPILGLSYFDTPSYEEILAVSNGVLYKSTGSSFSSVSGYSPQATSNVEFAQLVDKVYMSSGETSSDPDTTYYVGGGVSCTSVSAAPKSKYLVTHTNRLFAANTENYDDEVAASDLLDGGTWGSSFQFRVGGGEGDPIVGIVSWYNFNLLVFKKRSIHVISTDPSQVTAANWNVHRIDNTVGCESHRTIAQAGADVFFLARDGVRTVRTILSGAQSSVSEPISIPIDDYIKRINWSYASKSCAKFWNNRYIISVPIDSSTTPNYTLVFNTITKSWSGYWTGWTPLCFSESGFSSFPKMIMGDSSGNVSTWLDYVSESSESISTFQDNGTDYASKLVTRAHVFGDYLSPKLGNHVDVELQGHIAGSASGTFLTTLDGAGGSAEIAMDEGMSNAGTTNALPIDMPFNLPTVRVINKSYNLTTKGEFNEIQFIAHWSSGYLHLRSIKASAYMNTMALEK